ncbi:hypothetical protein [Embleya hyalina]|nr:hypothetical protein [Embleya hyalina]
MSDSGAQGLVCCVAAAAIPVLVIPLIGVVVLIVQWIATGHWSWTFQGFGRGEPGRGSETILKPWDWPATSTDG